MAKLMKDIFRVSNYRKKYEKSHYISSSCLTNRGFSNKKIKIIIIIIIHEHARASIVKQCQFCDRVHTLWKKKKVRNLREYLSFSEFVKAQLY